MRPRRASSHPARAGFTFVELAVVMIILLVALLIFSSTISGLARQRAINRENRLAMDAARNQIELLRSEVFQEVFARHNSDPADDPEGPATAPGHRFAVADLQASPDALDGLQGELFFPTVVDGLGDLQLREDLDEPSLGMPRDLSGDSIIDDQDHADGYFILPVRVLVRWSGKNGVREYQLCTQICQYVKA
jgi:prepilin-type N-terminal cleavage/methylation domain-containing protein